MIGYKRSGFGLAVVAATLMLTASIWTSHAKAQSSPAAAKPENVDLKIQGEYEGELEIDGVTNNYGLQVIALGNRRFNAVRYKGGLPGAGWNGLERYQIQSIGQMQRNGFVLFEGDDFGDALIFDGTYQLMDQRGKHTGDLKRIERNSPVLGKKPPAGAIVLFDSANVDAWKNGKMTDDKSLMPGAVSKQTFGDHKLHIEFQVPFKPESRGPARGNCGVFIQGRWEIKILDSLGRDLQASECGAIVSVKPPDVNMSLPPTTWQTFDIEFKVAQYNELLQFRRPARVSVWHNGVRIHNDVELPNKETVNAPFKVGPSDGPICLQEQGDLVLFRNIWVVPQ